MKLAHQLSRIALFISGDRPPNQRPRDRIPEIYDQSTSCVRNPHNSRAHPAPARRISLGFDISPRAECVANVKIRRPGYFFQPFASQGAFDISLDLRLDQFAVQGRIRAVQLPVADAKVLYLLKSTA